MKIAVLCDEFDHFVLRYSRAVLWVWQSEAGHSSLRQVTQCFLSGFSQQFAPFIPVFWVRIWSDPELFGRVGSGSRTVPDLFEMKSTLHNSLRQVTQCFLPGFSQQFAPFIEVFWVRIRSDSEPIFPVVSGSRTIPDLFDMKSTLHS
jgi:hypothetical protein